MKLETSFPQPAVLPPLTSPPGFDLARDAEIADLPRDEDGGDGITLPLRSTTTWGDDGEWPIDDWYASSSRGEDTYRMKRAGITAALAGAQALATQTEAVAVVQSIDGRRYLVPLGVWNPVDESQLSFEDAGGLPHFTSPKDYVLLGRNEGTADVEAVVFGTDTGTAWLNLTGHPIKLDRG